MFKWSSQTTFLLLVGVIALMVFSVTLFSVGFLAGQTIGAKRAVATAQQKLESILPSAPAEVYSLSGTVKEVKENTVVIKSSPLSSNPFDDQGPKERAVKVGGTTVLQELHFKTAAQIQQDNAAYQAAMDAANKSGAELPTAPLPYRLTSLTLGDLVPGDLLVVNAKDNIRMSTEFEASEINRTQRAAQ